jgi:hypothetical protein
MIHTVSPVVLVFSSTCLITQEDDIIFLKLADGDPGKETKPSLHPPVIHAPSQALLTGVGRPIL